MCDSCACFPLGRSYLLSGGAKERALARHVHEFLSSDRSKNSNILKPGALGYLCSAQRTGCVLFLSPTASQKPRTAERLAGPPGPRSRSQLNVKVVCVSDDVATSKRSRDGQGNALLGIRKRRQG